MVSFYINILAYKKIGSEIALHLNRLEELNNEYREQYGTETRLANHYATRPVRVYEEGTCLAFTNWF